MMLRQFSGSGASVRSLLVGLLCAITICAAMMTGAMAQQNLIESIQVTQQGAQTILRVVTRKIV